MEISFIKSPDKEVFFMHSLFICPKYLNNTSMKVMGKVFKRANEAELQNYICDFTRIADLTRNEDQAQLNQHIETLEGEEGVWLNLHQERGRRVIAGQASYPTTEARVVQSHLHFIPVSPILSDRCRTMHRSRPSPRWKE